MACELLPTVWGSQPHVEMAGTGNQPPAPSARPQPPASPRPQPVAPLRKPPQVLMIKKDQPQDPEPAEAGTPAAEAAAAPSAPVAPSPASQATPAPRSSSSVSDEELFDLGGMEGLTMADLLGPDPGRQRPGRSQPTAVSQATPAPAAVVARSVDDFDFDADAFLAALDEQDFVGTTGEVVKGTVIGLESDGVYVDIGGKAPGFMQIGRAHV